MGRVDSVPEQLESATGRLDAHGRVVVPSEMRRALGLKPGDRLAFFLEGEALVIKPLASVEKELWAELAPLAGDLAGELIAERREEAAGEDG